ncbi:MAG: pectinesterase family protein [Anaeroplasma sp.]
MDIIMDENMSLYEAIYIAKPGDIIYLYSKIYKEKVIVNKPHLTFIGNNSTIEYDDYHARIIPIEKGGDGVKTFGTTGSTTFLVNQEADYFIARNIVFKNTHYKSIGKKGQQAVAFKSEASNILIENCSFVSQQDTLYIDYGFNNKIVNCYIEGDIDFIFGSANCEFKNCRIIANNSSGVAYFTAPDTLIINDTGFVFINSVFNAPNPVKAFLGRAWFPTGAPQPIYPRLRLYNCSFIGDIELNLIQMHEGDPTYHELIIEHPIIVTVQS